MVRARLRTVWLAAVLAAGCFAGTSSASAAPGGQRFRMVDIIGLYADPAAGRPVELPNIYDCAWRLQDGTDMMTDKPNFDPNVAFGLSGTRLQVIR